MKRTDKPTRHSKLAEQLTALMAYRSRPEPDAELAPVQTAWTTVPSNDNADPEEVIDFSFERKLLVTPSVEVIMRNVAEGETERNDAGQIVAIGNIEFSDGTKTEKAYATGPEGNVITFDARMPVGAMLRTREKSDMQSGGSGVSQAQVKRSNYFFADMLGTADARYVKRSLRRNGKSLTADQSRAVLAEAIANTPAMPAITYCPLALPCGSPRVSDSFLGMQKGKKGEGGAIMWQDLATSIVNREIWEETLAAMPKRYVVALDTALEAETMADVGTAVGQADEYARRRGGRRVLIAANDNLQAALQKAA